MIEEYAVILASQGQQATLELERHTACGLCGKKRGCGNETWGKLLGHHRHTFTAQNPINAQVGDSVVIGIEEGAVLNTAFFLYIVPLLAMLIGAGLAEYVFDNEFYVMVGAVVGLLVGFMWVKGYLMGTGKAYSQKFQATILRRVSNDEVFN